MSSSTRSSGRSKHSSSPRSLRQAEPIAHHETAGQALARVRKTLAESGVAAEPEEAQAESEILLAHALETDVTRLFASFTEPLPGRAAIALDGMLERRLGRAPLRYITGACPFYGRDFLVDERVLIPRQETELIVERALAWAGGRAGLRVADVGTGSGVLAVTLALELQNAEVQAADVSADALSVARENARRLGARVMFHEGDLAGPLKGRFDVVVANLPYVRTAALDAAAPELAREPRLALDGGPDGLRAIRRLVPELPRLLETERAIALLEIDPPLVDGVAQLAGEHLPEAQLQIVDDLAGLARVAEITTGG